MSDVTAGWLASQAGDRTALEALLQQHLPALRAFARLRMSPLLRARESSQDLVQSACCALVLALDSFEYRGEEAFRGLAYKAVASKGSPARRPCAPERAAVAPILAVTEEWPQPRAASIIGMYGSDAGLSAAARDRGGSSSSCATRSGRAQRSPRRRRSWRRPSERTPAAATQSPRGPAAVPWRA